MFKLNHVFILLLCFFLTSCSYIYGTEHSVIINRDTDYLNAKSTPPLRIPPGLSSSTIESKYPVPYREYPRSAMEPSLVPPDVNTGK